MKKSIFGTPLVASAVLLMVFAAAFATYNTTREGDSSATSNIGCAVNNEPIKLFFQDNPSYATRNNRVLLWDAVPERTFTLPNNVRISPGLYDVRVINSDTHYDHRSSGPNDDVQDQREEQSYIEIDGTRSPNKSTDFTDFYDWRGGPGELIQDDDNNLDSIPSVVRNTWQGESVGTIEVRNATNKVTASHTYVYDSPITQNQQLVNSVVPSAIILQCVDPGTPVLEIEKDVDGDGDGTFHPTLEKTNEGDTVTWKVTGRNTGDADDPNASMYTCAPTGTTLVANSATVVSGGGSVSDDGNCITWTGPLDEGASAMFTFETVINDFAACDAADTVNEQCSCDAAIYSAATSTSLSNPADIDDAAVEIGQPDLAIDKTVDANNDGDFSESEETEIDQEFTWRVVTTNTGDFDAAQSRIQDTAPGGVLFVGASVVDTTNATQTSFANDATSIQWDGRINAGGSVTIEITAVLKSTIDFINCDADSNGTCVNEATVSTPEGSGGFEVRDRDDANVTIPKPSLAIEKTVDGLDADDDFSDLEEVEAGQEFTWKIAVTNSGTVDARNYRISDQPTITDGYRYTAVTTDGVAGGEILRDTMNIGADGSLNIDINLASGRTFEFFVTAVVDSAEAFDECDAAGGDAGRCVNVAQLFELDDNNDPVDADPNTDGVQPVDQDDAEVILFKDPVLSIVKTVDGNGDGTFSENEEITPGASFEWKVVVSNAADAGLANNVVVTDNLAPGVRFTTAEAFLTGNPPVMSLPPPPVVPLPPEWTNQFNWAGDLEPGESVEFVRSAIVADVDAFLDCDNAPYQGNTSGDGTCHNRAYVGLSDGNNDVTPVADDGADVTMNLEADLEIVKQVDGSDDDNNQPGRFSDNDVEEILLATDFTWQIMASNTGTADEPNARVVDTLPAGVVLADSGADSIDYSVDGQQFAGDIEVVEDAGRTTIVWTGELDRNATLTMTLETEVNDYAAYLACVAENTAGDVCRNIAAVGTTTDSGDPNNFTKVAEDPAYVEIVREPVLEITKLVDGDVDSDDDFTKREAVLAEGTTARWQIVGCNVGTADEPNAAIYPWAAVDGLQDSINYVAGSATIVDGPGTISVVGDGFVWNGELIAGNQGDDGVCVTIEYETTIDSEAEFEDCDASDGSTDPDGNCTLNAQIGVQDPQTDEFTVADVDDAQVYREPRGELVVAKTVDGDGDGVFSELEEIVLDEEYHYRVTVTNEGDGTIENGAMRDALPKGVISTGDPVVEPADFGSASVSTGDRYLVFWTVPSFEPGDTVTITFPVRIADQDGFDTCDGDIVDGAQDDICTNTAAAGTGTSDEDWEGLTEPDPAQVVIKKAPELYIDKTVDGTDADTEFNKEEQVTTDGAEFTYKVVFGNRGTADAEGAKMTTGVPTGLEYVAHELETGANGEVTYDETAKMLMWNGDLAVGDEFEVLMTVRAVSLAEYTRCDVADGTEDLRCACSAILEHDDYREDSTAIVNTEPPQPPEVDIEKLVDGNGDGEFAELEEITIGAEVTWQVSATNRGGSDLTSIVLTDNLVAGMKYIPGSLVETQGADLGIASQVDDNILWTGDIPAGQTIAFEFKTTFTSLAGYQECNLSDGNADDEQCTNPVTITDEETGEVLGEDDANVNTPVPRVLAYTGTASVNYIIIVGVVIAAITIATAVIAYITRPRNQFGGGANGGPTVTIIPNGT